MARGWVGIRLQDVRSLFVLEMASGWVRIRLQDVRSLFTDVEGLGRDHVTKRQVTI